MLYTVIGRLDNKQIRISFWYNFVPHFVQEFKIFQNLS